jgi:hypothetical protein
MPAYRQAADATERNFLQSVQRRARITATIAGVSRGTIVALLAQAQASSGRTRPVLSVGRDGVTVGEQPHGFFEVATCATITVYDRRGKRLGTVYLGYAPQLGQDAMTTELKLLLKEILLQGPSTKQGTEPLPRLCYVTDCVFGDN